MIEEFVSFVLIGFGAGLQVEEIPLVSLWGLLFFLGQEKVRSVPSHHTTLYGRLVNETIVIIVNQWRTKEGNKGMVLGLTMQETYTQVRDVFLQLNLYFKALYLMAAGVWF